MTPSQELKQQLTLLYHQKEEIETKIAKIEFELSQSFSTNDKIEIFSKTFLQYSELKYDSQTIKNHLLGIQSINYNAKSNNKYDFLIFSIDTKYSNLVAKKLFDRSFYIHQEQSSNISTNCWCFFEYGYNLSIIESLKYYFQTVLKEYNIKFVENQILPLSLNDINHNHRLFIDPQTKSPYNPQWNFLKNIKKIPHYTILSITNQNINIILDESIHIPSNINFQIINELKQLLTFENPIYQTLLKLRKPIFNTSKQIKNFTLSKTELILPRGIKKELFEILDIHNLKYNIVDNRIFSPQNQFSVKFTLRPDQQNAIDEITKNDYGVCVAPPGFGKTLIGAKMIEKRSCSTLILVHKNMLLDQWISRLSEYFGVDKKEFGFLGKSKNQLNKKIDIATIQSLKNNEELIKEYSFLIIDECHHIPAYSFETMIKQFSGKYILGLSATPHRKDELEPLLFHQVGNIVYEQSTKSKNKNQTVHLIESNFNTNCTTYTEILGELIQDKNRNNLIIEQILKYKDRNIILLSDRVEHIAILEDLIKSHNLDFTTIHGSQTKKEQSINQTMLHNSKLILSSSSYFGEGVDLEHLDTIVFATPISYYGRIIQYLGRVGRGKNTNDTLCIDILDVANPILLSTFRKRKEGFVKLGYKIINTH